MCQLNVKTTHTGRRRVLGKEVSRPRIYEELSATLFVSCKWRTLDQESFKEQRDMGQGEGSGRSPEPLRAAQSQSELALVPGAV